MASAKMHEYLSTTRAMDEARSIRWESSRMSSKRLPVRPDDQDRLDRSTSALKYSQNHTDREVAAAFPDVVQYAVPVGFWEKIKPRGINERGTAPTNVPE